MNTIPPAGWLIIQVFEAIVLRKTDKEFLNMYLRSYNERNDLMFVKTWLEHESYRSGQLASAHRTAYVAWLGWTITVALFAWMVLVQ